MMPETQTVAPAGSVTLTAEQFQAMLEKVAGGTGGGLSAEALAEAFAKQQKRENATAPMVSVYNPYGETLKPRPDLRCKTLQNGVELDRDTLTWEEIEALNALPGGAFRVAKANGNRIAFTVALTHGLDGEKLEKVDIHYPSKDEHRYDHRPIYAYCLDVLTQAGMTDEVARIEALHEELERVRQTLRLR